MAKILINGGGTIPQTLSLDDFVFSATGTGGIYSKTTFIPRFGTVTDTVEYVLGGTGKIVAVNFYFLTLGVFTIKNLDIPLSQFTSSSSNIMPLLTAGSDAIEGAAGADNIFAGAGNDIVHGMNGDDTLYGEAGADQLFGGAGSDKLFGGAGDDFLYGGDGVAQMDGGDGFDMVVYNTASSGVTVNLATGHGSGGAAEGDSYTSVEAIGGSAFNDILTGTDSTNYIWAGAGNDVIFGLGGSDNLDGAAGDDSIYGGAGDDHLYGGDGNDTLHADAGNDSVFGGAGNDYVIGTGGALTADGGAGHDQLYGGSAADHLSGGIGDDLLLGNGGNDRLNGGAGIDVLSGGLGADVFFGGADADYFVMNHDIAYAGYDNIGDFRDGVDWLQLPEYARHLTVITNASFGCVVSIALADSSYNLYIAGVNAHQIADQIYYYGS
jgi:Ca2+-binding RTX toxin-like protein